MNRKSLAFAFRSGAKGRLRHGICMVVAALTAVACTQEQEGATGDDDGRHEFAGYWDRASGTDVWWPVSPGSSDGVPYTPEGLAAQRALEEDPARNYPAFRCEFNFGLIVSFADLEIVTQPPDRVIMTYPNYEQKLRWIWTDGRDHPEGAVTRPMFMGYSVGRWEEGDEGLALVVDTIGVEAGYLRQDGLPNTTEVHITERYSLMNDGDRLTLDLIIDDSNYYTEPWSVAMAYTRRETPPAPYPVCRVGPEYHALGGLLTDD